MTASRRLLSVAALLVLFLYASVTTDAARREEPAPPTTDSLTGQLLVATPELDDPNFRETVVYIVHHDQGGAMGLVLNRVLGTDDLVAGDNCFFAATGITDGNLLKGVHYNRAGATTQSLVMRSRSGTVRMVDAQHRPDKLEA